MPETFEDFEALTFDEFEQMAAFFTRLKRICTYSSTVFERIRLHDHVSVSVHVLARRDIWNPETVKFGCPEQRRKCAGYGMEQTFPAIPTSRSH